VSAQALAAEIGARIDALPVASVPAIRAVRREYGRRLAREPGAAVLALAARLAARGGPARFIAYELVGHHRGARAGIALDDIERIGSTLDGWAPVDAFGVYVAGPAWRDGCIRTADVARFARSADRWWRRLALVATVGLNARSRGGAGDAGRTLEVCRLLVTDRDDMVVKALSWALRELAKRDPDAVRRFVAEHAPRLAARVKREVANKLETGIKNPRGGRAARLVGGLVLAFALAISPAVAAEPRDVSALLDPIRERGDVPGLVACVVRGDGTVESIGASGVRRTGSEAKVTVADRFHIGSCTKSMTATLCAKLVEEGRLRFDSTLAEVFPDVEMHEAWRGVTLEHLLTNRAGVPSDLGFDGLWGRLWRHRGSTPAGRRMLLEAVVRRPPEAPAGTKFIYANGGFAIAGHMAETATGMAWEDLIRKRLFEPLGMGSAGFGAPGSLSTLDEPRGHTDQGKAMEPGPGADNPASMGPAGTVHCPIGDWARYAALHLRGARGLPAEATLGLPPAAFAKLHTQAPGADARYAMGWGVGERDWAGGRVLTHNGSNTMWFAVVWIAPARDFAVLVACNKGGGPAAKACDEAASALIGDHLAQRRRAPTLY